MTDVAQQSVLTTKDLAERWGKTAAAVVRDWRRGRIPEPLNPWHSRSYRWSISSIEAFENSRPVEAVLTLSELAERWRIHKSTVVSYWKRGLIPAPVNSTDSRSYRWALAAIEAFERGERGAA